MPKRAEGGFTLIEILVALAVAGGALVLVLSGNAASLARSIRSQSEARLERAAESVLAAWRAAAEPMREGPMAGFDRHSWEIRTTPDDGTAGLKQLIRATFRIYGPGGEVVVERVELVHGLR